MAIDGLILLDNTGRPIIQSGFRSTSIAYPLLHVDAFNHALAKAPRPQDIEPVLYVSAHSNVGSPSACCHVSCGDMRLLCPVSGDVDPLLAFAFLQTFVDILKEYFNSVNAGTMRENFDVVYQLLEETLDSGGHPLTTSLNALRDIVLPPSLLSKILSVAGANINPAINSGSGLGSAGGPFSSPIPWRKAGVHYSSNEIYFDLVEDYKAIVNKNGVLVSSSVWGKIEANAHLSGTPDCLLAFKNPHVMVDCSFHPCIRLQRWARDKRFSFVPPDGRFILAEYRFSPNAGGPNPPLPTAISNIKDNVPLPLKVKTIFELEELGGSFDITLTSQMTAHTIKNLSSYINLGREAGGIKCIASRGGSGGSGGSGRGLNASTRSMDASWSFNSSQNTLHWEIPSIPPSSSWNLRGSFSTSVTPRPMHAIQFQFEIQSHTFSSLRVDQLEVTREMYKPFKGVRGRSTGNIEWRW